MGLKLLTALALSGGAAWPGVAAQVAAASASNAVVPVATGCRVVDASVKTAPAGGAGLLMAICGTRGAPLGAASRYRTIASPLTGSVLVIRERGGKTAVLLASPTSGGVAVDDVTRDLAKLTGRFGDLGLGPFTVDTTRFAADGSVGVSSAKGMRWLDLKAYAARALTVVTAPLSKGIGVNAPSGGTGGPR